MSRTKKMPSRKAQADVSKPTAFANQALFQMAFHNSPALQSVVRARDGVIVEVNDTFLQKFGRTREQTIGKTPVELASWVEPEKLMEFRGEMEAKGFIQNREVRLRASNGNTFTVLLSSHSINIDGEVHYLSAGVDITPRKEAEANLQESERKLRESEARFSSAFRACPVMMNIARLPDGGYVEVNDAFARWVGLDRSKIIGHAWPEFAQFEDAAKQAAFFGELDRTRSVRNVECRVRLHDGRHSIVLVSADIIEINRTPHILGFAINITEQKKIEQALRESEARTRALYESISAAVAVQDETGFLQINSASLRVFGPGKAEDILGKQPTDFSPPKQPNGEDSAVAARRHMERAMANGTERFEWLSRRLDGSEIPVEVTLTAVELNGRPALQAVIIDLTERKRTEAELQNALAKERELNQLKTDFVSLVSHEFRTPLEVIMSSTDNLQRYHERLGKEKREQLLNTVNRSVRRMAGMMEEVLVLGRFESGKTEYKPVSFDVAAFCARLSDEVRTATSSRNPIEVRIKNELPEATGDENLLRHILSNLLANAVKYSEEGKKVVLEARKQGKDAVFRIIDKGCGIPAADQPRLFQAFRRGSNVRQIPGTGLGLVIVQRCVELHRGELKFESTEGKGTTFSVRMPLFKA